MNYSVKRIPKYALLVLPAVVLMAQCKVAKDVQVNTPKDTAGMYSYAALVQPIMEQKCTGCHGGNHPASGIALTTYEEVRLQTEQGNVLQRITDKEAPMPPGEHLMDKELLNTIAQWAANGYVQTSDGTVN